MALIKCPKCGKEVSNKAKNCPYCDVNFKEYEKEKEKLRKEEEERKAEAERKKMENKQICPECGEIIDKELSVCPKCAYPIKEERIKKQKDEKYMQNTLLCVAGIGIVLLCVAVYFLGQVNLDNHYADTTKVYEPQTNVNSSSNYDSYDDDYDDSDTDYDEEDGEKEPYIGMSAYDAEYNSTWGSPQDKNITETQYGSREQWVYGSGRYLYIEDDEVVSIQK